MSESPPAPTVGRDGAATSEPRLLRSERDRAPSQHRPTVCDALHETRPGGAYLSVWTEQGTRDWTWDGWRAAALAAAAGLRARGVGPGSRVGAVLANTPEACHAAIGTWLAGGTLVSLPTIARGMSADAYGAQLAAIAREAELSCVLVEGARLASLPPAVSGAAPLVAYESLPSSKAIAPSPPGADDVAFVQYSSGTTREPRGCCLTAGAIQLHNEAAAEFLDVQPGEQTMTWLPLSHDFGFFGFLITSFGLGLRLWLGTPRRFLRAPRTWFDDCAAVGARITGAPNFALELAAHAARSGAPKPAPLRRCLLGGEPNQAGTLERALHALAGSGLRPQTLEPIYGLAEAVGGLTTIARPTAEGPRVLALDRGALMRGDVELLEGPAAEAALEAGTATGIVSCGAPASGMAVRLAGTADVGEIYGRSPCLATGYLGRPDLTRERFADGEVRTGDLGFIDDGELFVVGRDDDILMVAGSKVWARDAEALAQGVRGVRLGSCVLVDIPRAGTPALVMLAEPADDVAHLAALAHEIAETVREGCGVQLAQCLIVPRGTVPKTPSGKPQRHRCRELIAAPGFAPVGSTTLA